MLRRKKKTPRAKALKKSGKTYLIRIPDGGVYKVDREHHPLLSSLSWAFDPSRGKPRAFYKKKRMFLHKVVCLLNGVDWKTVEFVNGDHTDCRFSNLRELKPGTGRRTTARKDSSTGLTGVYPAKNKYAAMIGAGGQKKFLGYHSTLVDAGRAYAKAWNELNPDKQPMKVTQHGNEVFYS